MPTARIRFKPYPNAWKPCGKQIKNDRKRRCPDWSFLVDEDFVRLDTRNKYLMDILKFLARNSFFIRFLQPFKEKYDNYRDDHVLFSRLDPIGWSDTGRQKMQWKWFFSPRHFIRPKCAASLRASSKISMRRSH